MGLAASQGRLLLLTARKSDLELRAQQITNTEMILAMQTEAIAKEYSNKLSNKDLMLITAIGVLDGAASKSVNVSYTSLTESGYRIFKDGVDITESCAKEPAASIQEKIKRGIYTLRNDTKKVDEDGKPILSEDINITGSESFYDTYHTQDDGEATAVYEAKMAEIQVKEKQLQLDLQQVETQQKACDTEIDSVKKIIDKNIDRTFKVFA